MAKQILATPVSIVAVKQQFRVVGNILNATCSFMSLDSVEAKVCLDDWTKAQYRQQKIDQEQTYEYFKNDQTMRTEDNDD